MRRHLASAQTAVSLLLRIEYARIADTIRVLKLSARVNNGLLTTFPETQEAEEHYTPSLFFLELN